MDIEVKEGLPGSEVTHVLGPVRGPSGNEKNFGVYPLGCDICVRRDKPACGFVPGKAGCKSGPDPYHPDVPCQYQGVTMGGGSTAIRIAHLAAGVPVK